ncbi:MAG: hypothetical protein Q9174_005299 [Haloplaca sp. 1 TL-2023]
MGNDGGSIPKRRELVKEAAKDPSTTEVKETQKEKLQYYWAHCALSQKPLSLPIVSDSTGNLYNKDAVLEKLIDASQAKEEENVAGSHQTSGTIKNLRDVVELQFKTEDPHEKVKGTPAALKLVCSVTGKTLGPGVRAVYIVPCGHAFSECAVREMASEQCLECNEPYSPDNLIPILPTTTADEDRLRNRASKLQASGLTHSLKKTAGSSKKRKKEKPIKEEPSSDVTNELAGPGLPPPEAPAIQPSNGIRNEDTASLTARVLAEQEDRNKRRKIAANDNLKALFSSSTAEGAKQSDFMTRGFSIPAGAKR